MSFPAAGTGTPGWLVAVKGWLFLLPDEDPEFTWKRSSNAREKYMGRKGAVFAEARSGLCLGCQVIDDYSVNSSGLQPVETFLLSEKGKSFKPVCSLGLHSG